MKWDTSVPVCNLNQEIVSYKDGLDKHSYSRPDHHLYGAIHYNSVLVT